jgi:hypothetical protein
MNPVVHLNNHPLEKEFSRANGLLIFTFRTPQTLSAGQECTIN